MVCRTRYRVLDCRTPSPGLVSIIGLPGRGISAAVAGVAPRPDRTSLPKTGVPHAAPTWTVGSRSAAENRYWDLRPAVVSGGEGDLAAAGIAAELRPIELAAFAAFTSWQDRLVDWPWPRMPAEWRRSWPERFELAIWSGDILCGLTLGRPSRGPSHMSLYYIEGNPDPFSSTARTVRRRAATNQPLNAW